MYKIFNKLQNNNQFLLWVIFLIITSLLDSLLSISNKSLSISYDSSLYYFLYYLSNFSFSSVLKILSYNLVLN